MKRKRVEKLRGSRTYGRGKKAGRGAGLRGGRGNAGLLKHKRMHMLVYDPDHFGRKGFKRAPCLTYEKCIINVGDVQSNLTSYLETGIATKEGKNIIVDLTRTDAVKLLGAGSIKSPLTIKVYEATDRAKEKVKAAGGMVDLPFEPEEPVAENAPSNEGEASSSKDVPSGEVTPSSKGKAPSGKDTPSSKGKTPSKEDPPSGEAAPSSKSKTPSSKGVPPEKNGKAEETPKHE